eukprot:4529617-Alexandrium_andersonii.AAC.1
MSASLVGSEMCIRDRYTVVRGGTQFPAGPRKSLHFPQEPSSVQVPAAVSYTHLTLPTICSV